MKKILASALMALLALPVHADLLSSVGARVAPGATLTGPFIADYADYTQTTSPAVAASGHQRVYANTNGDMVKADANGDERLIGYTDNVRQYRNYVTNGSAEVDTTGWTTYNNGIALTSISNASPAVFTLAGHLFIDGCKFRLTTTGTLPTGLSTGTDYYVKYVSSSTFQAASTQGGASINTSGAGSGTHTARISCPRNGTGGGPTNTWARSTSSPIRGTGSFTYASGSAAGNGVAYDFTLDSADLSKVITVSFDYNIVTGTYADGDLTAWIIQDPGSTITKVQPTSYKLLNVGSTTTHAVMQFQADSALTGYRLAFHQSGANTSYTVKIDNIQVGPRNVLPLERIAAHASTATAGSYASSTLDITNNITFSTSGTLMDYDTHAAVSGSGSSWVFTAPQPGTYAVQAAIVVASHTFTAGKQYSLVLFKNGQSYEDLADFWAQSTPTTQLGLGGATTVKLNAGDVISLVFYTDSGTRSLATFASNNHIAITRVGL